MDPAALRELFSVARARDFPAGDSRFMGADLRGAFLLRANLSGGNFSGAQFDHASLSGARFVAADLSEASLVGVELNGADLTGADLRAADLSEARIEGACFTAADLRGASLKYAGGRPASVAGMRIDHETFRRSEMTDSQLIELWRDGATVHEIERFSERVRHACREAPAPTSLEMANARDVALAEAAHRSALLPSLAPKSTSAVQLAAGLSLRPSLAASGQPAKPGDTILGVQLVEMLGRGPNGAVWKARDSDNRKVAVKIFDGGGDAGGGSPATFKRGVQTLNRAQLLDEGAKMSLPRVRAMALNELAFTYDYFDNGSAAGIPALRWDVQRTLEFFGCVCRTVAALHEVGLTHRSLKPSNVLVDDELRPVLVDPGMIGLRDPSQPLATQDAIYRAPEELGGESTQSPTADVYGLGRLLWFLLLGTDPDEPYQDVAALTSLDGAPRGLLRIVRKATAHDPGARYQWVEELEADLAKYLDHDAVGIGDATSGRDVPKQLISLLPVPVARRPVELKPLVGGSPRQRKPKARPFERAGGFIGLAVALLATFLVFITPTPSPELAAAFGLVATVGLALGTLLLPSYSARPLVWRLVAFALVVIVLSPLELERLVILRWKLTLDQGDDEARARVARFLARRGARDLRGAQLARANLRQADFGRANLGMANLARANLAGANLSEANLGGADVTGADVTGADLTLSSVTLAKGWLETHCNRHTAMPKGFACVNDRPVITPAAGPLATQVDSIPPGR